MRFTIVPILVGLCVLHAALAEAADKPGVEVAGGISSLASGACCLPTTGTTPVGWDGSVTVHLRGWFSVVGEASGDYETIQPHTPFASITFPAERTRTYAFMGGPRVTLRATTRVGFFGQLLFGATHGAWSVSDPVFASSGATNHAAWQPGGGVEIAVARRWAVRVEGDYRITPIQGLVPPRAAMTQPRFMSGLVFRP